MGSSFNFKIALLLFTAWLFSLFILTGFYSYINNTKNDIAYIELATRQSTLIEQVAIYADMVNGGQDEDRGILSKTLKEIEISLDTLLQGGMVLNNRLPAAPEEIIPVITQAVEAWRPFSKTAQLVAELPQDDQRFDNAYQQLIADSQSVSKKLKLINHAFGEWGQQQRKELFIGLQLLTFFNLLFFILGLWFTRGYINQMNASEKVLSTRYQELEKYNKKLKQAQQQLLQAEKMASIGQLAAGVAHEINNPIGYVNSNIGSLRGYINDLLQLIDAYQEKLTLLPAEQQAELHEKEQRYDLDYLRSDIQGLVSESLEGLSRVRQIVKDLKDFSRIDETEWQEANIHDGINSTLKIVWNELKYKAEVLKNYGDIPDILCIPSQLNQVFLNMLVNAAHAIEERGVITITTGTHGEEWVWVKFADTGRGIDEEHLNRIFDPFFTTKAVGKGTGLGLSLSYSMIENHNGRIEVHTELGKGTEFTIYLPIRQAPPENTLEQDGQSNPNQQPI